ncbi:MAG: recombinase family protein [Clostridia bacterium]|nr:recombinase family protein [Clostridia bacterium]
MEDKHLKVAIYVRVSTKHQVDKDSLKVQKRDLISYCKLVMNCNDYEIFEDAGFSAKNTERPDYQAMMEKLRTRQYTHLLVWKIDRISRNLLDFATMYAELKDLGVDFVSKNEQFDTSTAMGEAMLKIILVFAELERKMTSERVTAVMYSRASNGQWNGGRVPYGYKYTKKSNTFTVVEEQAGIVRRIFRLYELYESTDVIVSVLSKAGIAPPYSAEWSYSEVKGILSNSFYKGTYEYGTDAYGIVVIENHHPAIIPAETFDKLQPILANMGLPPSTIGRPPKHLYIFQSMLVCGNCGRRFMSGHTATKKLKTGETDYVSYLCNNVFPSYHSKKNKKPRMCSSAYVNEAYLAQFVLSIVFNLFLIQKNGLKNTVNRIALQEMILRNIEGNINIDAHALSTIKSNVRHKGEPVPLKMALRGCDAYAAELEQLQNRKQRYETALNRLNDMRPALSEEDYDLELAEVNSRLESVTCDIADLTAKAKSHDTDYSELMNKAALLLLEKSIENGKDLDMKKFVAAANPEFLKNFFHALISTITITNSKVTQIAFLGGLIMNFTYSD